MKSLEESLKSRGNRRILVVFPHPDDESFNAGGLIQRAKKLGYEIKVIILTKGEKGKNHLGKGNLAEIREMELREAGKILGIEDLEIWDHPDGELKDEREWVKRLEEVVAQFRPGLVVSYDFSGMSGHPDHIVLSKELFEILRKKKEIELWWSVWPGVMRQFMRHPEVGDLMQKPTIRLNLTRIEQIKKFKAMKAHKSQWPNLKWWQRILLRMVTFREYFAVADFERDYEHRYVGFEF